MRLPERPGSINELRRRLATGELRETRTVEFKREFPSNRSLAKQIAGFAVEGGALVIGVAEDPSGFKVAPINCNGARERVEQIARDIPEPPVQIESHILSSDSPGHGVLWVEIPASSAMLHQVEGTYYERGDTQTRPMRDSDVADRMRLREDREAPIQADLHVALNREEPGNGRWQGRTCIVVRPIGASENEFFQSARAPDDWKSFAYALTQPSGMLQPVANRYWGMLKSITHQSAEHLRLSGALFGYRDIEFQESGAFCHLSYCHDWLPDCRDDILADGALLACREAIFIIGAVQARTGQRRMWDLAFSVSNVQGKKSRKRTEERFFGTRFVPEIPRDRYEQVLSGVTTRQLERDPRSLIEQLADRFIAECGLEFDEELPPSFFEQAQASVT